MATIGSFGAEIGKGEIKFLEGDDFEWCGTKIRLRHPSQVSEFPLITLMGQSDIDTGTPEGMRALVDFFKAVIFPDDVRLFEKVSAQNGVGGEAFSDLLQALVPVLYNRPTSELSDLPIGQPSTTPNSPVDSSSTTPVPSFKTAHLQPSPAPTPTTDRKVWRDPHFGTRFEPVDDVVAELGQHSVLSSG